MNQKEGKGRVGMGQKAKGAVPMLRWQVGTKCKPTSQVKVKAGQTLAAYSSNPNVPHSHVPPKKLALLWLRLGRSCLALTKPWVLFPALHKTGCGYADLKSQPGGG